MCLELLQNNSQNGKMFISKNKELTAFRASGEGDYVHATPESITR